MSPAVGGGELELAGTFGGGAAVEAGSEIQSPTATRRVSPAKIALRAVIRHAPTFEGGHGDQVAAAAKPAPHRRPSEGSDPPVPQE